MIEREIISTQDNCFFNVAIYVTNEIKENEISKVDFDWSINDINVNVDSFDEDVAKNVNFAFVILTSFAFDVEKNVNIAISFDVKFANSLCDFFWWWFCTWLWSLMLLENFALQRLHAKTFARFLTMRAFSICCCCKSFARFLIKRISFVRRTSSTRRVVLICYCVKRFARFLIKRICSIRRVSFCSFAMRINARFKYFLTMRFLFFAKVSSFNSFSFVF